MLKSAFLSPCGTYRYKLGRSWDPSLPPLVWVMLNPSTADADVDDPTIRRVVRFTQRSGDYGSALVVNLFALRATNPKALASHYDPVGPRNDEILARSTLGMSVVVAWGAHAPGRAGHVLMGPLRHCSSWCLGKTKAGAPRHPLYVKADQPFERFR